MKEPDSVQEKLLETASLVLLKIDAGKCTLDDGLDTDVPNTIRRLTGHLLLNLFRYRKVLRRILNTCWQNAPKAEVLALLECCAAQIAFQNRLAPALFVNPAVELAKKRHFPHKFVNAVLRKFSGLWQSRYQQCAFSAADIFPDPVLQHWQKCFSAAEIEALAREFTCEAQFTFRIEKGCPELDFPCTALPGVNELYRFAAAKAQDVLNSSAFAQGKIYIQDPATALAPGLADYSSEIKRVLDLCAAPGGKSLMMLENLPPDVDFSAFDISRSRQKLTRENFARRGIDAAVISDPAQLSGKYDLILLDAPCSNSGVFRRRPDALWRFNPSSLQEIVAIQHELLELAGTLLADGGQLIYSTCSIESAEDSRQIAGFCMRHRNFTLIKEKLLLPGDGHDGAYAALLRSAKY